MSRKFAAECWKGICRFFLLSFFVGDNKIRIIHEFFLGLFNVAQNQPISGHVQQDRNGQIYCIVEWFMTINAPQTGFHVVKVNMDDNGLMSAIILANNWYTGGTWFQPFIVDDALHWRPHGHDPKQTNLLRLQLNTAVRENVTNIKIANNNSTWPAVDATWFWSALIGNTVYYYTCHAARKVGHLCQLNIAEKKWNIVQFDMRDHAITGNYTELKPLQHGCLVLSGTCSNASCANLEHIFMIGSAPKVLSTKQSAPNLDSIVSKIGMTRLFNVKHEKQQVSSTMSTVGMTRLFGEQEMQTAQTNMSTDGMKALSQKTLSTQSGQMNLNRTQSDDSQVATAMPMTRQQSIAVTGNMGATIKWTPGSEYDVQEKLGQGSFGIVNKCFDSHSHKLFVAKKLTIPSENNLQMCEKEVLTLKSLNHPRIIDYYGCRAEGENIVIFMEYMAAGSLRKVMDKLKVPVAEDKVLEYVYQILEGLIYIHEKNIVHRDIKCDNLLLDGQGNIKLGDFGISIESQTYASIADAFGGTLNFIAPEVIKNGRVSRGSDIWSLGCTIVEMCTMQPPYHDKNKTELMAAAYGNIYLSYNSEELLKGFASEKMILFVASLLQKDPNNRPHTASVARLIFNQTFPQPSNS